MTSDAILHPRLAAGERTGVPAAAALIGFVLLAQAAGLLGSLVTDADFYRELARPSWAPPGWLFAPVWLTLYTLIGVSAWLVWRRRAPGRRAALIVWSVQLALNAAWTPVFFGLRAIGAALALIVLLEAAILATIARFHRHSRLAAWLLVPYAAWVGFAIALNASIWLLQR
jgi:translocator protein